MTLLMLTNITKFIIFTRKTKTSRSMVAISKKLSLLIFFGAGFIFIGIGISSVIDSSIPRFVEISVTMKPNQSEMFTPDMNSGNIANIYGNGSDASVLVIDPNNKMMMNKTNKNDKTLNETITALIDGEYRIQVINDGNATLSLNLGAFSKADPLALTGQMMLIITGIVVIGLGFRARMQSWTCEAIVEGLTLWPFDQVSKFCGDVWTTNLIRWDTQHGIHYVEFKNNIIWHCFIGC